MLFFNFLCLFYLMVLINSHTISKSIAKDDEIINVIDSVRDLDNDKEHDIKQNRFHIRNSVHKDISNVREDWSTKENTNTDVSTLATDNINLTMDFKDKSNEILVSKSRRKGFLRRLLDKIKRKNKKKYLTDQLTEEIKTPIRYSDHVSSNESVRNGNYNIYSQLNQNRRRIQRRRLPKRQISTMKNKEQTVTNSDASIKRYGTPENFIWRPYYPFTAIRTYTPVMQKTNDMSLSEMTTKINYLKEVYGMTPRGFAKFMSIMTNPVLNYNWNQHEGHLDSTTILKNQNFDTDSLETSQIEELLNKIKMKAVQDVTVSTETAFESYSMSNEISRNVKSANMKKKLKRGLEPNARNKLNYGSVDDLKKVYAKVKSQLSKEFKMSENIIKNETQYWAKKLKSVSNANNAKKTTKKIKTLYYDDAGNSQNREKKLSYFNYDKKEFTTSHSSPPPITDDDYSLISKCELLLKNAYQSNYLPALSTERINRYFYGNNIRPMRSANVNTIIAPSIYEDIDNATNYNSVFKYKTSTQENYPKVTTTYKELADKLYYNDYVNGYKHYLKFQKEQGVQNYSNLVRYQAHKHHSVNDIGKFILDKLPRVPDRHIRAFYDESATTEDQDVSSKSEESWFKKHFYLFIDSGQPKKYHSSQTVSLRPTATKTEKLKSKNDFLKENHGSTPNNTPKHGGDSDLDHLANILDIFKSHLVPPSKNSLKNRLNSKSSTNTNSPLAEAQSRLKRNKHNHGDEREYQLFHNYLPKTEFSSPKELSHKNTSPTFFTKNERHGYVDVNLVAQPTAVVGLRNVKHGGGLKKFLNHFRLPFHKKKDKEMAKSTTPKNLSRNVRCLNPLKKLKKMFNVRIDGKPIILGSNIFDYDVINTHIDPYRQINYDKQSVNLNDAETKMPTVIPEAYNLTDFSKDLHFNTSVQQVSLLAKKYYQNPLDNTEVPGTSNNSELETNSILVDATINPLVPTSTVHKTKNKAEFEDSELINIKVTTVRNFSPNSYNLPSLPFVTESSFVNDKKIVRHKQLFTDIFRKNLPNIYLSSGHLHSGNEIKETKKFKRNNELHNREKNVKVYNPFLSTYARINARSNQYDELSNEKNEQGSKQALINLNRIAKLVNTNANSNTFNYTKKRNSKIMHRYKVTPNYLNDLEIWHNDILNSENYTTWQNILKSIQHPLQYRPPNLNVLRKELDRLNIRMGDIKESVTNVMKMNENSSKNSRAMVTKNAFMPKSIVRRECNPNQLYGRINAETVKYLKKPHENRSNINLTATTTNQYHASDNGHFKTEKIKIKSGTSTNKYSDTIPETSLSLDTTLLAYDDSLNFLTETSEESTLKSSLNPHALDQVNLLTKLHKVPEQYFSTPLPMRSEDFEVFLKEHNIDVESVTTPLNFSSNDTLKSSEESALLNILPHPNEIKFREYGKTKKIEELMNIKQNTTKRNSISSPIKKIGRYFKNELDNNIKDKFVDVSFTPKNNFNDERSRREIYKYLHIAASKPDYLFAGLYSKYSKFKNHFKNVDREKYETVLSHNFTSKSNKVDGTEQYLDILENHLESGNNDTNSDNDTGTMTGAKTFKPFTENPLRVNNFPQNRKYVDFNPFENKTNVNASEFSRVSSDINAKTNVNEKHMKFVEKEKSDTSYTNFVHNNLLFNYMYDNGKKEKVSKYNGSNAVSYNVDNTNSIIMKNSLMPGEEIKLPTTNSREKLYSNPRRIHVSSKTLNYDIIFDDYDTSHKHNIHKLEERYDSAKVRDEAFENNLLYTMSTKESTSDSEDEQIKELVRVVEAVDNFTRPNVLLYVDLPTYYLPDTDSTDPTPIRSPPKSFWNDFILKYVSGIALIELLTKFGLLKTEEANFSDGMDEDVNKCGRFSGAAEPSFAMDLKSADSIRRVLRSETEDCTTQISTASSLEPIKKATMIYDLKQLGRPRSDGLKSPIGPNRKGTSILSLLLKQGRVSIKETTHIVIPWSANNKSSTETPKEISTTTSKIERNVKDNEKKEIRANEDENGNIENKKYSKSNEEFKRGQQDATARKLTTMPLTLLKAFGTIAIHTLQDVEKGHTTTRDLPPGSKIESNEKSKTNTGDYRFYIATSKILPKDYPVETNHKEKNVEIPTNKKITPTSEDKISNVAKVTTVIGEVSPATKTTSILIRKLSPAPQKNLNINKSSGIELLTSIIIPATGSTHLDFNTPAYEDSYYVTNNYYDYHGMDNNYNELGKKDGSVKNTTKITEKLTIKHDKRDLKSQNTFTAKDVAAIEVIVDLLRHNRNSIDNEVNEVITKTTSTFARPLNPSQATSPAPIYRKNGVFKNSIQVHIAIPCNLTLEKKRSLNEPVRIRKVFSARLSTPVDMEYQIHSLEDLESLSTVTSSGTTTKANAAAEKFSPGLYVLVENKNGSFPDGQFILKPVYNNNLLFDYTVRQAVPKDISTEKVTSTQSSNLSKVTLSKDFIAAINKHLVELYRNLVVTPGHDIKERTLESVNVTPKSNNSIDSNNNRQRRNINWDTIKKYFGRDKVCSCHCKPNRTMCRTCAASDAVISELIFELENLAKYMSDHCTEIQTYFWMNPSGGRRLRDAVQRIDKALYDYFKRVKGKCKGRPCKVFTCMDKRDYVNTDKKLNYIGDPLIRDVERVADHLEQASKYNIGDRNLFDTGNKCLEVITKCMHLKPFNKRAHESDSRRVKNVYSLDNVNVNIICKSDNVDTTHNNVYYSTTKSSTSYLTESPNIFYYDDTGDYTIEEKHKKGFKSLLKRRGYLKNKRKNKKLWFTYNVTSSGVNNNIKFKKRDVINNYRMELPFNGRNKGSIWCNFFKNKNRSHDLGETHPQEKSYTNLIADHDITNILNISFTVNKTKHNPSVIENNKNKSIDIYATYTRDFTNVTPQKNIKPKFKPYGRTLSKKFKINPTKSTSSSPSNLLDMENYEPIQDITAMDSNISNIQTKKKIDVKPESNINTKVHNNDPSFHKHDQVSALTTVINKNLENVKKTHQNFLRRFKDISLKFLNDFQLDRKTTTPIYKLNKSTKFKRDIKKTLSKAKSVIKAKVDSNRNERLTDKTSCSLDSTLKEKNQLQFDYNESTNNKRELLLSVLDFETSKLNDEWEMVAAKKAPNEDGDEENPSIFQIHSEVSMPPSKASRAKIEHTITATSPCTKTKPTTSQKNKKTGKSNCSKCTNKTATTTPTTTPTPCKQTNQTNEEYEFYDIKKDLPEIELSVPPELFTTRAYHGLFDKFISQFRFKVVSKCQTVKAAKSRPNGPKGRSFKRKLQHGNRFQVTELSPVSRMSLAEELRGKASYSNKTTLLTLSTTLKKESKSTESMNPETTTESKTEKTAKRAEDTRPTLINCSKPILSEEVCDSGSQERICDIDATMIHILKKYKTLTIHDFKKFVKNITCFKYKRRPSIFLIKSKIKKKSRQHVRDREGNNHWKWNWVRGKRSSESMKSFGHITNINHNGYGYFDDDTKNEDIEIKSLRNRLTNAIKNDIEDYDRLYLGGDGVYRGRENERKKRKVDMSNVINGLKGLPPLRELVDEVFVIRGYPVTIYCNVSGTPLYSISNLTNMYRYSWAAERKSMLYNPNLRIVGPSLVINDVQPKNYGTYTCCQDRIVSRSIRLNVIEIPNFKIVFTPLYKCLGECTYEDLENIQSLGMEIIKSTNCCGLIPCTIRVDNPVAYANKANEDLLKPTIVITAAPPLAIECDPECLRDLACSLALLWAANAPSLAFVKVVIMYEKFNNTLTPVDGSTTKMTVLKKLKSRDSNGHREYVDLALTMSPGDVDVVVACPAGFYLLTEQKICAVCPENTCAAEGENTCSACPRGTHSEPGSAACRLGLGRLHSYFEKCAQVPWQWWASGCLVSLFGLCLVLGFRFCRRLIARPRRCHSVPYRNTEYSDRWLGVGQRHGRRPLSPSRVLLERIYKRSQSSSRATDSQETKFVLTPMNVPPPIPPIDFDY